jgi:hypothetical protein
MFGNMELPALKPTVKQTKVPFDTAASRQVEKDD